jgi:signal transduction histidine kinase
MIISKELKNVIWSLTHRETSAEEQMRHLEASLSEMFLNVPSECKIDFDLGGAMLKIEFLMDLQLMLLEMASNFIRHSSSTQASVKVHKMGNQVVLRWMEESPEIKTLKGSGLGLMSIQNRYEKWKGKREKKDAAFDYCIFFEVNEISA